MFAPVTPIDLYIAALTVQKTIRPGVWLKGNIHCHFRLPLGGGDIVTFVVDELLKHFITGWLRHQFRSTICRGGKIQFW